MLPTQKFTYLSVVWIESWIGIEIDMFFLNWGFRELNRMSPRPGLTARETHGERLDRFEKGRREIPWHKVVVDAECHREV